MRVGHLCRIPDLLRSIGDSPLYHLWTDRPSDQWDGVSLGDMIEAVQNAGFINCSRDGHFELTVSGNLVVSERTPSARFRRAAMELYAHTRPPWIFLTTLGREAVRASAPPDDLQCLSESGLLDDVDQETVAWWDALASSVRAQRDESHTATGRSAESLTIAYESFRTGTAPRWIALESTLAGYDVLSRVSSNDASTLTIEVKGSTRPLPLAVLNLSRNEWSTLRGSLRAVLDAWLLCDNAATLHRVDVQSLGTLIPIDQGSGRWETVSIQYSSLPPACVHACWTAPSDKGCQFQDVAFRESPEPPPL